ncbi:hypothetical protein Dda_0783 [Drechslerella dactyloides]|uniref:Uncharacterized protein n=1 Tax=Drechslerella dactyloides TaxID=74499 RepID=A0AAD6J6V5_DREDA|nr:hypothetical protein Dda_0783 [Drechslerella dactyloides]
MDFGQQYPENEVPLSRGPTNVEAPSGDVLWPGSTYVITDYHNGMVLTYRDDVVHLAPFDNIVGQTWMCHELNDGWLSLSIDWQGFSTPSPLYLGFYGRRTNMITCREREPAVVWRTFHHKMCFRMLPGSGVGYLHMKVGDTLLPLGVHSEQEVLDETLLLPKLESQTSELSLLNVIDKKLESQSSDLGSLNTAIKELQSQMSGLTKVTEEQKKFEKATDITLTGDDTPWPGNIYIISDKDTSQVLTYKHPRPIFTTFKPGLSSQQWVCHENNGWIGFASDAGPTLAFLGHRDDWKIACEAPHFRGWECYVARKRPDGGYQLLMNDDPHLRPMGRDDDGALRVIRSGNTDAWWGFTKI